MSWLADWIWKLADGQARLDNMMTWLEVKGLPRQAYSMFQPGDDIKLFVGDEEVSDAADQLWAVYLGGVIKFRALVASDRLSLKDKRLLIVPHGAQDDVRYGGASGRVGTALIRATSRPWVAPALVDAVQMPDGRVAFGFKVILDGELLDVAGKADSSDDIPWNWYYGLDVDGYAVLP